MPLQRGWLLGPYEIVAPLGAGGMGEVYRARDTRLSRFVAIKVLPVEFEQDETRRRRFLREAKAIADLRHPNIGALYDIGETALPQKTGPIHYLVLELIEGQTLAHRLKSGALPVEEALTYAIQLADALDKAHRRKIIHRDVKPSNIMITKSGVKLLDFGLAKTITPPESVSSSRDSASGGSEMETETSPESPITSAVGMVGTFEYAAPEQLRENDVDARTDVYALGLCMYEMVTGRRPFRAETRAKLAAAILEQDPPSIHQSKPAAPRSLDWLIRSCLAKDPDDRVQTAHDVMLQLEGIARETNAPETPRRKNHVRIAVAAVVVLSALAVAAWRGMVKDRPRRDVRNFSIALPNDAPLPEGAFEKIAVSPDGNRFVFVGGREPTRLYLHTIKTRETRPIANTEGAKGPFFSPDGEWIGFYSADGALKKIAAAGGGAITLSAGRELRGAAWGALGTIVFAEPRAPLRRISAAGGRADPITTRDSSIQVRWPSFLPDGEHVLCTVAAAGADYENAQLAVLSLKAGTSKMILDRATYGRYVPTGHIIYVRSGTLFAVPFDADNHTVRGTPVPLLFDVDTYFQQGLAHVAFASDGSLFYIPKDRELDERRLVWVDRSGHETPLPLPARAYEMPRLSPDGAALLLTIGSGEEADVWTYDIARGALNRLTDASVNQRAIWSPDGKSIAFTSNRNRGFNLFVMPSDGSDGPRLVSPSAAWASPTSWTPDGDVIAAHRYDKNLDVLFVPSNSGTPQLSLATPAQEGYASFSPDGRWVAYQSDESGRNEVYIQRYPSRGKKKTVSTNGGAVPMWRRDGRELFYRSGDQLLSVDLNAGADDVRVGTPRVLFAGDYEENFDVTPDGARFIMVRRGKASLPGRINVVLGALDNLNAASLRKAAN